MAHLHTYKYWFQYIKFSHTIKYTINYTVIQKRRTENMGGFLRLLATVVLMLMLIFSSEMVAEATRKCESKSQQFKGLCFIKANCAAVCRTEGFHSGHCRGFRRRCYCTKHC
ncbi:defensin [Striga asiatica]|uniref:Defensin n=1 Tax=Striga asiatica TaxID=4170 RepID=A0A5A7PWR6_STRAF|nr:defensin [Striga asiatica]